MISNDIISKCHTPIYIVDEDKLISNLEILKYVKEKAGCKILLAQKAFSMFYHYNLIGKYLCGATASSLDEAMLSYEHMIGENHIFSPAYTAADFNKICGICEHIVFNSVNQYNKFNDTARDNNVSTGIRINPMYSEIEKDIYNPCVTGSRLGVKRDELDLIDFNKIDGLHFHTMCEQNSDTLKRTLEVVEGDFSEYLGKIKWLNMGGGHHISRDDYDVELLISLVKDIKSRYNIEVYLEPGEAIAYQAGYLVSEVIDIVNNGMDICIMDTSAACHMPDVIEMPYRPYVINSDMAGVLPYTYRLGGPTCLAGDIIGDYSFNAPLKVGDRLVFTDMAIYTMVKNNTFNGIRLPSIATYKESDGLKIVKTFTYEDFKNRLS